eukprot:2439384-Lingulodinium_polyedra.AAC.1
MNCPSVVPSRQDPRCHRKLACCPSRNVLRLRCNKRLLEYRHLHARVKPKWLRSHTTNPEWL